MEQTDKVSLQRGYLSRGALREVVVITGAPAGIGRATDREFARPLRRAFPPPAERSVMGSYMKTLSVGLFLFLASQTLSSAEKLPDLEAALHGFPALLNLEGKKLADGDFAQWLEGQRLHVK